MTEPEQRSRHDAAPNALSPVAVAVISSRPEVTSQLAASFVNHGETYTEDRLAAWLSSEEIQVAVVNIEDVEDLPTIERNSALAAYTIGIVRVEDLTSCLGVLRAGAHAVVAEANIESITDSMRWVLDGRIVLPLEVVMQMASPSPPVDMSREDQQLLQELAIGRPVKSLADRIHSSRSDTYRRLRRLYHRIGVQNRSQAIAWAERHGVLRTLT